MTTPRSPHQVASTASLKALACETKRRLKPKRASDSVFQKAYGLTEKPLADEAIVGFSLLKRMNQTRTTYRVRQTFQSFGPSFEETFKTLPEAKAYARVVAAGIAVISYGHVPQDYADIPYVNPRRKNPSRETTFFMQLSKDSGAHSDVDGKGFRFHLRGKMKWRELVDRIYRSAIEIKGSAVCSSPTPKQAAVSLPPFSRCRAIGNHRLTLSLQTPD